MTERQIPQEISVDEITKLDELLNPSYEPDFRMLDLEKKQKIAQGLDCCIDDLRLI